MSTTSNKVSFTIRRPTPLSRSDSGGDSDGPFKVPTLPRHVTNESGTGSPLARSATSSPKPNSRVYHERDSSDDEDEQVEDELVTGFDQFGVQRLHKRKEPQGPLVIPALQNRDWRELARKRKTAARYVPASAKASTGADGSVGGLGTKDTINPGPHMVGLQVRQKKIKLEGEMEDIKPDEVEAVQMETEDVKIEPEETEDQKALRAILAGTDSSADDGPVVDVIHQPVTEADALRQDVEELPDEATLDDYARVPVSQFGAALLRGMGWKEGTAASRKYKGPVEPYLPTARPSLLGIGAKEREAVDDGSKPHKGNRRPERRYVPVVKREKSESERDGSGTPSGSGGNSRRRSPSPRRVSEPSSRRSSRSPSRRYREDRRSERDYEYTSDRGSEKKDRRDDRDRDRRRSEKRDYGDRDRERRSEQSSRR